MLFRVPPLGSVNPSLLGEGMEGCKNFNRIMQGCHNPHLMTSILWKKQFDALQQFKRRFHHCRVPRHWPENPELARWVSVQRNLSGLTFKQVESLYSLGFDFGRPWNQWLGNFFVLARYRERYGECRVVAGRGDAQEIRRLGAWSERQRKRCGHLQITQKRLLDDLGFDWDPRDSQWQKRYGELQAFKERYGHCNAPDEWPENPSLAGWVNSRRLFFRHGWLAAKQVKLLEQMGFQWFPLRDRWESRFKQLQAFKEKHGHCNVPAGSRGLGNWVVVQRRNEARMPVEHKRRLSALGFQWHRMSLEQRRKLSLIPRLPWEENFRTLQEFQRQHGHCRIPRSNARLSRWLAAQRLLFKTGGLKNKRFQKLKEIGVRFSPHGEKWAQRYQELVAFHREHGHCEVPPSYARASALAYWVRGQRVRRDKLTVQQERQLTALGFRWKTLRWHEKQRVKERWEKMYEVARAFKQQHGHLTASREIPQEARLSAWLVHQRQRKEFLPPKWRRLLDQLGMSWNPALERWEQRFKELLEFKKVHGHMRVPSKWEHNPVLANWVEHLRCHQIQITPTQKERLRRIGFLIDAQGDETQGSSPASGVSAIT